MLHSSSEPGAHLLSFAHVLLLQCPSQYPSRWQLAKCHQTPGPKTNAAASQAHSRALVCFQTGKAGGAMLLSARDLATRACHHHYPEVLLGHRGEHLGRAFPGSSRAQQFVVRALGAWCADRDLVSSALLWCGVGNGSKVAASPFPEVAGLTVATVRLCLRVKRAHAPPSQLRAGQDGLVRAPMRHDQMANARSQSVHCHGQLGLVELGSHKNHAKWRSLRGGVKRLLLPWLPLPRLHSRLLPMPPLRRKAWKESANHAPPGAGAWVTDGQELQQADGKHLAATSWKSCWARPIASTRMTSSPWPCGQGSDCPPHTRPQNPWKRTSCWRQQRIQKE